MAKSTIEDRLAFLERFNTRLLTALNRHFSVILEPDDPGKVEGDDQAELLDGMTVAELREYATEKEIDLNGATLKADIIAKIKAAPVA